MELFDELGSASCRRLFCSVSGLPIADFAYTSAIAQKKIRRYTQLRLKNRNNDYEWPESYPLSGKNYNLEG